MGTGIKMLDQLPGDVRSAALGINDKGQIVGLSRTADAVLRAVFWENPNAVIKNLNDFVAPGSPYLLIAGDINSGGRIAGYTGDGLGFLATPSDSPLEAGASAVHARPNSGVDLPERVRKLLRKWGIDH